MLKVIRRRRLNHSLDPPPQTRISLLPIGHLSMPSLRWWDGDKIPTHHKSPLLGLKLSSHSFLDSSIQDDLSAAAIYIIKTTGTSTTVLRCGGEEIFLNIAIIKWPSVVSTNKARDDDKKCPSIKMGGYWIKGQVFLRSESNPDSSRKFIIPDCSNAMKWKRYGNSYWCTTSGVKGPVATLDLANGQEPIRLAVYETLLDKYDPQALLAYKGVSLLLLDYLVVTALLCATDVSAWMKVNDAKDTPVRHAVNSGVQKLAYVPRFPDHPYAMRLGSAELRSIPSKSSLTSSASTVSGFPKSRLYGSGVLTESDSWFSKRYSDPSVIEDWSKDYLAFLDNTTTPSTPIETIQAPHTSMGLIHRSRNASPIPPLPLPLSRSRLPLQLSRPSAGTSHLPGQPHRTSIHSPLQSPETKKGPCSPKQPPNVLKPTHTLSRSESYLRPLPKPPTQTSVWRRQSKTQLSRNLTTNSPMRSRTRRTRLLPPIPLIKASEPDERRAVVPKDNGSIQHAQSPPMTKASQDLTRWVHETNPQRVLPPVPLPKTVVFDSHPPSYSTVYFAQRAKGSSSTSAPTVP